MSHLIFIAFAIFSFFFGKLLFIQDQINTEVIVMNMTGTSVSVFEWALKKIKCSTDTPIKKIWIHQSKISEKPSAFAEPFFINTLTHCYAIPFHFYGSWGLAHGFLALHSDGEYLKEIQFLHVSENPLWGKKLLSAFDFHNFKEKKIVDPQHQLINVSFIVHESQVELTDPNQIGIGFIPHFFIHSFEKQFNMLIKKYEPYSLLRRASTYPDVALDLISKKFLKPSQIQVMQNSIFPQANTAYASVKPVLLDISKSVLDKLKPIEPLNYVETDPGASQKLLFFIEEAKKYMLAYKPYKSNLNVMYDRPTENPVPPSLIPQEVSKNEDL